MPETSVGTEKTGILTLPRLGFITVREARAHGQVVIKLQEQYGIENVPQAEYEIEIAQAFYEARTGNDFFKDYKKAALAVNFVVKTIEDIPFGIIHGIYNFYHEERAFEKQEEEGKKNGSFAPGSSDTISQVSPVSELNNFPLAQPVLSDKP